MKGCIIIMYIALALLTGCSGRQTGWQTGDVTLVRAVGVDRLEKGMRVSAAVAREEGGSAVPALRADGTSVADGIRKLGTGGDGFVHFGHTSQLLLGEELVRDGVEPLLDFVARDRKIGPGVRLWVLRDGTAEQVVTGEYDVAARLERLAGDHGGAAPKLDCTTTRLMSVMARGGSAPVPALRQEEGGLRPTGYAVLRRGRLVGFLDEEQSLGAELVCGRGADQAVEMQLPNGAQIVLNVERASVTCEPVFEAGRLRRVELRCGAKLAVAQGEPLTAEQRWQVERQAEAELCGRTAAALALAQLWDADFAGLEQKTQAACSKQEWSGVDWAAEFRTLALRVAANVWVDWPADVTEEWM